MSENFHYYGKHKKRSNYVLQKKVEQKGESFHFRTDTELSKSIKELSRELDHSVSKIIKDILEDFFLDQKLKRQKFELEGIE